MHLLVTDRLACARCGPDFGLILLADVMESRRVLEGILACPNCREQYPVRAGYGDLRPPPRDRPETDEPALPESADASLRLAALLGVREGPGLLLVVGPSARHAYPLGRMIEGAEVVVVHPATSEDHEQEGVSRIAISTRLPFFTASIRGVALEGEVGVSFLPEAARVLIPGSRLVFLRPPAGVVADMERCGLKLLMESETALIGVRK